MTGRIVVFGDLVDDIIAAVDRPIRPDTDTVAQITFTEGGSGANVAAWLGELGVPVDFHGRTGRGDRDRHAQALERFGVHPLIEEHPSAPTARIVVVVQDDHRTFLTSAGASATLGPSVVTGSALDGAFAVHVTGHSIRDRGRLAELPPLIDRARARGVLVSLDPSSAGFIDDLGGDFLDAIRSVDVLLPNLDEGRALTGESDPLAVARALRDVAATVVLTLGGEGVLVATADGVEHIPANVVELVDPTGAGDAFAAGFLAALRRGEGAPTAAREATRVAARAVSHLGGRPSAA